MKIEAFQQDLGFICKECEGANFDIDFVDTLSNPELTQEPNTCHRCGKTYRSSDEISFGKIYIRAKNGEKFAPSEVRMIGDTSNFENNKGLKN